MPLNSRGEYNFNPQRGRSMERMERPEEGRKPARGDDSEGGSTTLHSNGDGSYRSEDEQGNVAEHPHLGHALMYIAHAHEPEMKHAHVSSDGVEHNTHYVDEDGEHSGPHSHANIEALKDHLGQFLNEEEQEVDQGDEEPRLGGISPGL